jgi:hypothetical protein
MQTLHAVDCETTKQTAGRLPCARRDVLGRSAILLFDDMLEEHRVAGVSLRCGMHERVRLVACAFANERNCALGRWIHEEGARCDEVPELHNFWMAHTDFHTSGLVIAISITQGRLAEAAVMLEPGALFDSATRVLAQAESRSGERTGVGDAPVSSPEALRLIH